MAEIDKYGYIQEMTDRQRQTDINKQIDRQMFMQG